MSIEAINIDYLPQKSQGQILDSNPGLFKNHAVLNHFSRLTKNLILKILIELLKLNVLFL